MGFIKSLEEIAKEYQPNAMFYDAEVLTVYFETKPEVVKRLLPPRLSRPKILSAAHLSLITPKPISA